ncbi:hypothetical protein CC80DRAFT_505669 [Byssothecium circinans]|uniref:DUF7730 domain-containing protein n=1 Tax=Byssothecium circinans TaxID=147558 RepID=A0A6A5TX95_9PLEO|nr:hypothetical protein CC80DRAFT_505669 [Byssothecium circinans]
MESPNVEKPLIDIPRVYSGPIDSTKVSFLTLPPDIRNMVYDELFKKEGLIKVVPNYCSYLGGVDEPSERSKIACSLLATCRQIYHEGVTILYRGNTFELSEWDDLDRGGQDAIEWTASWLDWIGSNIHYLKEVIIDIYLYPRETGFDIVELFVFLCKHPEILPIVKFAHWKYGTEMTTMLSNVLEALVKHDTLRLRRTLHFPRLIESLHSLVIDTSGSRGFIEHNWRQNSLKNRTLLIEDEGRSLRTESYDPVSRALTEESYIFEAICVKAGRSDIRISLKSRYHDKICTTEACFKLQDLRRSTFRLLSQILDASPELKWETCPTIYINGFGTSVLASYHFSPKTRHKRHYRLRLARTKRHEDESIERQVHRFVRRFPESLHRGVVWNALSPLELPQEFNMSNKFWGGLRR